MKPGDTAYILESGCFTREVKVIRASGDLYTLKFTDTGGGSKLREGRLFPSRDAAEAAIKQKKDKNGRDR